MRQLQKHWRDWASKQASNLKMQVSVKLFGALREFLPAGSSFNACTLTIGDDAKLIDLLSQLPIPSGKAYIVLLNDSKLDKHLYAETGISASDEIVLLPPIKGG